MKYLFCTDGSKMSFDALEGALRLLKNGFIVDIFFLKEAESILKKLYKHDEKVLDLEEIIEKSKMIIEKQMMLILLNNGHKITNLF
jgi:predicted peroxiredoxin